MILLGSYYIYKRQNIIGYLNIFEPSNVRILDLRYKAKTMAPYWRIVHQTCLNVFKTF